MLTATGVNCFSLPRRQRIAARTSSIPAFTPLMEYATTAVQAPTSPPVHLGRTASIAVTGVHRRHHRPLPAFPARHLLLRLAVRTRAEAGLLQAGSVTMVAMVHLKAIAISGPVC